MPPGPHHRLHAVCLQTVRPVLAAGVLALAGLPAMAWAQDRPLPGMPSSSSTPAPAAAPVPAALPAPAGAPAATATPQEQRDVAFEANQVSYDQNGDTITAEGNVILRSEDQSVRA